MPFVRQLFRPCSAVRRVHRPARPRSTRSSSPAIGQVAVRRQGRRLAGRGRRQVVGSAAHRPGLHRARVLPPPPVGGRRRLRRHRPAPARTSGRPTRTCSPRSASGSAPTARRTAWRTRRAVPVDAVTASGSGLDPHISVANARLQAPRVAEPAGCRVDAVLDADRRPHRRPAVRRARRRGRQRAPSSTSRSTSYGESAAVSD